ncbi:MAG TPA: iron-sulfur cluster assembly scaffold protein, partial [Candidatus Nanoarchaeia archaeon]|nr:iron-sulfur cluster assembly scaffold protein [Candidatus Nanoarchaeia archaeon]
MEVFLKVKNGKIADIKAKTFGCVAAIATTSVLTKLVKGKTIAEAEKVTKDSIVKALGGVPPIKYHCSILGIEALHKAIEDYKNKNK